MRITQFFDMLDAALDWPLSLIIKHFEKRLTELTMTMIMLGEAMLIYFSPASVTEGPFAYMLNVFSVRAIFSIFAILGIARIIALALNGNWMPQGGYVRAVGAACGAFMWGQMDAALLTVTLHDGRPVSPGVPIFTILALAEAIAMYRALAGARNGKTH